MALSEDNLITQGTRGSVGKQLVFKKINGKTVVAKYPDMSNVEYNNVQKGYQSIFGQAVARARLVINDPKLRAEYEKKIRNNKNVRETSVYSFVIQEFMKAHSKKVPKHEVKRMLAQYIEKYSMTPRQSTAIKYLIAQGNLSNAIYQKLNNVSKPTATRDLQELVRMGVVAGYGKGAGAGYILVGVQAEEDEDEEDKDE